MGGRPKIDHDTDGLEDFIYLARWENSFDASDEITTLFGLSGLYGPNATGDDGETFVYGADLTMKWKPAEQPARLAVCDLGDRSHEARLRCRRRVHRPRKPCR